VFYASLSMRPKMEKGGAAQNDLVTALTQNISVNNLT
jgi:hypothetical protein